MIEKTCSIAERKKKDGVMTSEDLEIEMCRDATMAEQVGR